MRVKDTNRFVRVPEGKHAILTGNRLRWGVELQVAVLVIKELILNCA